MGHLSKIPQFNKQHHFVPTVILCFLVVEPNRSVIQDSVPLHHGTHPLSTKRQGVLFGGMQCTPVEVFRSELPQDEVVPNE